MNEYKTDSQLLARSAFYQSHAALTRPPRTDDRLSTFQQPHMILALTTHKAQCSPHNASLPNDYATFLHITFHPDFLPMDS